MSSLNFSIFSYLVGSFVLPLFLERVKAVGLGGLRGMSGFAANYIGDERKYWPHKILPPTLNPCIPESCFCHPLKCT